MNIKEFNKILEREFKKRGWTVNFAGENPITLTRIYRTFEMRGLIFKKKVWVTKRSYTLIWKDWAKEIKTKSDLKIFKDCIINNLKGGENGKRHTS